MARTVLKYDPYNAVALLTAAQILAERTHDSDLDRDDRLTEADADARRPSSMHGDIRSPPTSRPSSLPAAMAQLRGTAHEVIATVAFKKLDYFTAIKEYNAAPSEEKEHTDAVVWLRLAVANDKSGDYLRRLDAVHKAIVSIRTRKPDPPVGGAGKVAPEQALRHHTGKQVDTDSRASLSGTGVLFPKRSHESSSAGQSREGPAPPVHQS